MRVDIGRGVPTFIAPRRDGGVTIHQGKSHIMLAPDELAAVLDAIYTLSGQSSRAAAEKTTEVDYHP
ncbi:hypothetical protein BayCH28_22320 [Mycolicibacterium sp. CH28]|uniref:hypothetical protein n=1 Tax=Mycolicibacterium sp. CH28 TaxID=2512237 RepID=UPI00107FD77C|nr:hypothetical protein [Mycolicibacterium sp. CH28]TGD85139.1 hypothetical protein BayCH28_22320 [Mycolicibacterium sp. CH28]